MVSTPATRRGMPTRIPAVSHSTGRRGATSRPSHMMAAVRPAAMTALTARAAYPAAT